MRTWTLRRPWLALSLLLLLFSAGTALPQDTQANDTQKMLDLLLELVREDPSRSDSWRMIGRICRQQDKPEKARTALEKALAAQPDNIAAHFDLGHLLVELGESAEADRHFDEVMSLGPESSYADELVEAGIRHRDPGTTRSVQPLVTNALFGEADETSGLETIGYELQTFDGADDLDRQIERLDSDAVSPDDRLRTFVELGALYNTNLSLTPISRGLGRSDGASFQTFFNPSVEWIALCNDTWRGGPLARGYFTLNEGNFDSLNLSSFQPGVFIEHDMQWDSRTVIGRVDYVYGIDLLGGDRFGDRHALTGSLTTILPDADVVYAYLTTSYSDFAQDGTTPSIESLDGPAVTAGMSRFFQTGHRLLTTWSLGADVEWADTRGADFRYAAATLHGDATFQLTETVSLIPRAGIGYRDYPDFTGPIERDELTWRLGSRLRWQFSETMAVSAVVGYDRFASDNPQFDTDRTEAGIVFTWSR